jgi:hypothetical protein
VFVATSTTIIFIIIEAFTFTFLTYLLRVRGFITAYFAYRFSKGIIIKIRASWTNCLPSKFNSDRVSKL